MLCFELALLARAEKMLRRRCCDFTRCRIGVVTNAEDEGVDATEMSEVFCRGFIPWPEVGIEDATVIWQNAFDIHEHNLLVIDGDRFGGEVYILHSEGLEVVVSVIVLIELVVFEVNCCHNV